MTLKGKQIKFCYIIIIIIIIGQIQESRIKLVITDQEHVFYID